MGRIISGHVQRRTIPKCQRLYEAIRENPGLDATALAARLRDAGMDAAPNDIRNWLIGCDRLGLLVSQDDDGGLWAFERPYVVLTDWADAVEVADE